MRAQRNEGTAMVVGISGQVRRGHKRPSIGVAQRNDPP